MKMTVADLTFLAPSIEVELQVSLKSLQDLLISRSHGLYSNTSPYPGHLFTTKVGRRIHGKTEVKLINRIDGHHVYAEYGTGIHMDDNWSVGQTEDQLADIGPSVRTMPRPGKRIGPRGSQWYDLGGKEHKGWHLLVFFIGGKKIITKSVEGIKPQYRFKNKTEEVYNKANIVYHLRGGIQRAFSRTFQRRKKM